MPIAEFNAVPDRHLSISIMCRLKPVKASSLMVAMETLITFQLGMLASNIAVLEVF